MVDEIGVVDFTRVSSKSLEGNSQEDLKKVSREIVESFENIGYVYIKNHGIPEECIEETFKMTDNFFSLPLEVKRKYARKDPYATRYLEINRQILNKSENPKELRESFDVVRNTGYFPTEIEDFEKNLLQMVERGIEFFSKFLRCLEIGLDLPYGTLLDMHTNVCSESNMSLLRILHYPPVLFDVPKNWIRCGAHTDFGTITILIQDSMGGLEVKNKNNEWVPAQSYPGTFLVIAGNMLQTFTSGRFVATPHRVLIPEEDKRRKSQRKSVAFFLVPDRDVVLKPFATPDDDKKSYETSHDHLHAKLISSFA